MKTFGDRVAETGGYTSGFDYLRIILAVLVLFGHSFPISGDNVQASVMPWGITSFRGYMVLPMFFALSGFLVAASLVRVQSLKVFLGLRALRILPALCVEIALSALILGPLLTSASLRDYFTDRKFFIYFANMAGWIHYHLPGLFLGHPAGRIVNGSLWTVPYELECYIALAVLAAIGLTKRPILFFAAVIALCIGILVLTILAHLDLEPARGTVTGRQLVLFFLAGVGLYLFRDRVPWSVGVFLSCLALAAWLVTSHLWIYLLPFPIAYITAYLGLLRPRKLPLIFTGDYSYGTYLYAYPIQQSVFQMVPGSDKWWVNFFVSLIVVGCFAAFSWHAIEKPALRLKRTLLDRKQLAGNSPDEMISPDKTNPVVATS